MEIQFPASLINVPLHIKSFESHLPGFQHTISDKLKGQVEFGSVVLDSTNQRIESGVRAVQSFSVPID